MTGKERCLAMLGGLPVDRIPVFPLLVFLAADRAGLTYQQYATDGHVLAEAQLRVMERFSVDAITACSDASRVGADLGAEMAFPEDKPPYAVQPLLTGESDLAKLGRPDPLAAGSRMADRVAAVHELVGAAGEDHLVLGWVDMPFAEACPACGLTNFLMLLSTESTFAHTLFDSLTEVVIDFALAQVAAGAQVLGAGDVVASLVAPTMYREFALPYEQRVARAVHGAGALAKLHICGSTSALLPDMATSGCDLYSVDHMVSLASARTVCDGAGLCYSGNLDPVGDMLQAIPEQCLLRARDCLATASGSRFMLSAGCEISAGVTDEVFEAFCRAPQC